MPAKVLVGTTVGLHELGKDRSVQLAGRDVTWVTNHASGRWAIVDGREIWHVAPRGNWKRVTAIDAQEANCLLLVSSEIFLGTSEAHLFLLRDGELERVHSFDQTEGRDTWFTPWGGPPDVRLMFADPKGTVYVNVHVGGVPRSEDGGKSWHPTIDVEADVHQVLCDPGSGLVFAATGQGLAVSADGGKSWEFDAQGLHGDYLRAVAVAGETVLVTASTGPFTHRAALYRRPVSGGGHFERCEKGLPKWFSKNIDTYCLAGCDAQAAFGTSEGKVFVSLDQGSSWTVAAEGLAAVRCLALA